MTGRHWTYVGLMLLAGCVLFVMVYSRPPGSPFATSPASQATVPTAPAPNRGASSGQSAADASRADTAFQPAVNVLRADPAREPRPINEFTRHELTGREAIFASLKTYEDLWLQPNPVTLRAAEEDLLGRLEALPPRELVELLRDGLSTRPLNLVLITLENGMRGPLQVEYRVALHVGMEQAYERPDKLELVGDVALRLKPTPDSAESAARLLMKRQPTGRLAEQLGAFASRLQGEPRREVKQFAHERHLVEMLVQLVDDGSDLARLEVYFADPTTRARAERALRNANRTAMNEQIREQIQRALESGSAPK